MSQQNTDLSKYLNFSITDPRGFLLSSDMKKIGGVVEVFGHSAYFLEDQAQITKTEELESFIRSLIFENSLIYNIYFVREKLDSKENISEYTTTYAKDLDKNSQKMYDKDGFRDVYYIFIEKHIDNPEDVQSEAVIIEEALTRIENYFSEQQAKRLKVVKKDNVPYDQILEFLYLIATGTRKKIRYSDFPIPEKLIDFELQFVDETGLTKNNNSKFFSMIELIDFPEEVIPYSLSILSKVKTEFIVHQVFTPTSKSKSLNSLKKKERLHVSAETRSNKSFNEVSELIEEVVNDNLGLGTYSISFKILDKEQDSLNNNLNNFRDILNNNSFINIVSSEKGLNKRLILNYISQIPFNSNYCIRTYENLNTLTFSALSNTENYYQGKKDKNPWGSAVSSFVNSFGSKYYFNFHQDLDGNRFDEKDLGHTLILGASGSGKTVLMNYLLALSTKYQDKKTFKDGLSDEFKKYTLITFDKDYGCKLNILALNGDYFELKENVSSGLNPFLCEPTASNISFIYKLLKLIIEDENLKLSGQQEEFIKGKIDLLLKRDKKNKTRPISSLLNLLSNNSNFNNEYKLRLEKWSKNGEYGWVFDNDITEEKLKLDDNIIGIDGTQFLDNDDINRPISFYLLNKINNLIDGRRLIVAIDECWKWLNNEDSAKFIEDSLKTIRKKNGLIILATQSPEDLLQSGLAHTIAQQCTTKVLLSNPNANFEDYLKLGLTDIEFQTLKKLKQKDRKFLVKNNRDTVILSALLPLKSYQFNLLSSTVPYIKIYENLLREGKNNEEIYKVFKTL